MLAGWVVLRGELPLQLDEYLRERDQQLGTLTIIVYVENDIIDDVEHSGVEEVGNEIQFLFIYN